MYIKVDFKYSSLSFVRFRWGRTTDNLQLTGKISFKLDFNSSLILEYSCYLTWQFVFFSIL